ncbi:MAG: amidohydrolase [Bacteroidales bacterium]|nr:amidohydrolase [Bacteroidales bacterium]
MEVDILIKNAYIVTMNSESSIYEFGTLAILGNTIVAIGKSEDIEYFTSSNEIDAMGSLVMPGLINAHTHAAMSIYKGMADDLNLHEWLHKYIFPAEAKFCNADTVSTGSQLAIMEMIRFGTTCFADMYYFQEKTAEICFLLGMRAVLGQAILDFPAPDFKSSNDALLHTEMLMQKYNNSQLVTIVPGPHSPYTCNKETLIQSRQLANKYNVPLHIHISETMLEYEESIKNNEKTPIEYCDDLDLFNGKTIAAHCVYINDNDRSILKNKKVGVVNNAISNMKLCSGVAPVYFMKEAGVTVGIGTDGVVSNNTLDIFEEMKTVAMVHKLNTNDPTALNAKTVVEMATIENAKILGLDSQIGSLEVGKKADLILINLNQPHLIPLYNIYSHIVYAIKGGDVDTVIINGEIVMLNKTVQYSEALDVAIDAQLIANEVKEYMETVNAS